MEQMNRGPKIKTAKNSRSGLKGVIRHSALEPTSPLSESALIEFRRLICVLLDRGTLERIDLGTITEYARVTEQITRLYQGEQDGKTLQLIAQLTNVQRGLKRDMGLSLLPSRSVVHTNARDASKEEDPIASKIKLRA